MSYPKLFKSILGVSNTFYSVFNTFFRNQVNNFLKKKAFEFENNQRMTDLIIWRTREDKASAFKVKLCA